MSKKNEPTILDDGPEWYESFQDGTPSAADIAKHTGADAADVQATLDDMVDRQMVVEDGESSTSKTKRYRLTEVGRARMSVRQPPWSP